MHNTSHTDLVSSGRTAANCFSAFQKDTQIIALKLIKPTQLNNYPIHQEGNALNKKGHIPSIAYLDFKHMNKTKGVYPDWKPH